MEMRLIVISRRPEMFLQSGSRLFSYPVCGPLCPSLFFFSTEGEERNLGLSYVLL